MKPTAKSEQEARRLAENAAKRAMQASKTNGSRPQ